MQFYKVVPDSGEYLEHHGIKGQKWGVIRTPEQLGHKPRKTYEFKPYKTDFPSVKDIWLESFTIPFRMISEGYKRGHDPEYKKKSDEFINQHKQELVRRFVHTGIQIPLASMIYEINFASKANKPETKKLMKTRMYALKAENPDITDRQISQRLGVNLSYVRELEQGL